MLDFLSMIIVCTFFAYVIQTRMMRYSSTIECIQMDVQSKVIYIVILLWVMLFAGLRSTYNDTSTYMIGFQMLEPEVVGFDDLFSSYGGFEIYQKIIKQYISNDPQMLIFISSVLVGLLYVPFLVRHTNNFGGTIFLFLIGIYTFSMGGIKQALAIGIALHAIGNYLDRRYIKAIIMLLLAMTLHPYVISLVCIVALQDEVWSVKCIMLSLLFVVLFMNLDSLFDLISLIGKDYSTEDMGSYTINPLRVLVESVPVVMSFLYRKKINECKDRFLILGINMQVISFVFIALGLFFNPIYLGRMSTYFSALSCLAIPRMLNVIFRRKLNGRYCILMYYAVFGVYFLMDMTKIGSISVFYDQFRHVSIFSLF